MIKVFVSGKIGSEQEAHGLMALLESKGYSITFDWTKTPHLRPYESNLRAAQTTAIHEVDGVKKADVLILISHKGGVGMFVELGVALALDKPVIAISDIPVRTMFLYHPKVKIVGSLTEAVNELDLIRTGLGQLD